jgi:4-amino-4-deoxy-L-arabinose transferase-like glycosyltransferase
MHVDRRRKAFGLAAVLFTLVWFAMLFGRPLFDPDEGRYAEIPREMLQGGDWVIPHLDGLAYLEKPPLQYWATAAVYALIGISEGSARLVTGLAGYGSLLLVFAAARRLWGWRAAYKALLLNVGSILFVLLGHQLTLDMSLTFFLLAALTAFLFAQTPTPTQPQGQPPLDSAAAASGRWMLVCWAAMALAVLTKGIIGVAIPGFTLGVYVLWQRDFALLRRLNLRFGLPLFLLIATPWFVLAARANREFLWFFFVREHLQRFLTPIEMRSEPWWFFIPVLILAILPWITQALRALATGWQAAAKPGRLDARRLLWIWSVFVLVFFSLSHSKLIPYILPAIPTLALLCAEPREREDRRHLLAGALATLLFAVGALAYASARRSSAQGLPLVLALRPAVIATSAVLLVGAAVAVHCSRRRRETGALLALVGAWFAAAVVITGGGIAVQGFFSNRDAGLLLAHIAAPTAPVYSVQTYEQSLTFYLRKTVTIVAYRDELALGLDQDPAAGIADVASFASRWRASGDAYAIMPISTWDRLTAEGLPMRELGRYPNRIVIVARE